MAHMPLPGASYHTMDSIYALPDLEAATPLDAQLSEKTDSEKHAGPRHTASQPLPPVGKPVLLILLAFCCFALVASVLPETTPYYSPAASPIPERHERVASHVSFALRTEMYNLWIQGAHDKALTISREKYGADGGRAHGLAFWLREHLGHTFPLVHTLNRTEVTESAIIFYWPGKETASKPVLISSSHALLRVQFGRSVPQDHTFPPASHPTCAGFHSDYLETLADVESAVGMLTAAESLLRAGYKPSRTLVFVIMLGKPRDVSFIRGHLQQLYLCTPALAAC
ncbi:hypothetical protein BC834DRAFT_1046049 [Gloeopeniophorella convolvens]|nr:hypothetical protein BC834DRAFT_1046049 [Gloeopeniophorella convolvens]